MITTQTRSLSNFLDRNLAYSTIQILGASLLLALCSQIRIPLYFSPVPLTGQTLGVMLIGATLGSRKGFLSILAYLIEGALGLPVFAGGSFGLMSLIGPTGGYLIGFLFQAYLAGVVLKSASFKFLAILSTLLIACATQLGCGVLWLSFYVGLPSALSLGLYPFVIGEMVKVVGLTCYLKAHHKSN